VRTLRELHGKLVGMHAVLGSTLDEGLAELGDAATTTRIQSLRSKLRETEAEYGRREDAFQGLQSRLRGLWGELEMGAEERSELDARVASGAAATGLSTASLEAVRARAEELEAERERRASLVESLGAEISVLWVKLGTSAEEQRAFLESRGGLGLGTVRACEAHLQSLRDEFARRVGELLEEARSRVRGLWGQLRRSAEDGEAVCPEAAEAWAKPAEPAEQEECFNRVREHALQLEAELEEVSAILALVEKREAILADKDEYQRIISDPSRLLSRGGGAARLREEKLERRIKKELPQVLAKLAKACADYEAARTVPFCVDGKRVLDILKEEADSEAEHKRKAAEDRKRSKLPGDLAAVPAPSAASAPPAAAAATTTAAAGGGGAAARNATKAANTSARQTLESSATSIAAAPKAPLVRAKAAENRAPPATASSASAAAAAAAATKPSAAALLSISEKARAEAAATLHAIESSAE
jgi:hypothetical protein